MSYKKLMEGRYERIIVPIIFWGFWILLVWWLMARTDNAPDYSVPDNGQTEEICVSGYPC